MGTSPFHGIFSALQQGSGSRGAGDDASAQPHGRQKQVGRVAVDIYEQDGYYIIKAPIAGVRLSDLDIEVNGKVVTIRGSRRQPDAAVPDQYYLQECFWGAFERSVTLPVEVDARKIRATFNKECILKILIPKEEKVRVVKIAEA